MMIARTALAHIPQLLLAGPKQRIMSPPWKRSCKKEDYVSFMEEKLKDEAWAKLETVSFEMHPLLCQPRWAYLALRGKYLKT